MNLAEKHSMALEDLVHHLEYVDEDRNDLQWIMKEGIYTPGKSRNLVVFPDVLAMYEYHGIPIELKKCAKGRKHAIEQLEAGKEFINNVLDREAPYGKIVYYGERHFDYETIPLK